MILFRLRLPEHSETGYTFSIRECHPDLRKQAPCASLNPSGAWHRPVGSTFPDPGGSEVGGELLSPRIRSGGRVVAAIRQFRPGRSPFDSIMHVEDDGTEWWSARELMPHLGYARWENGENAVRKARSACRNAGHEVSDHFRDITKMIDIGKGGQRSASDVQMTRFGCYLVAMNSDPDKVEVAAAQRYFALMTRAAEKAVAVPVAVATSPRPWSVRFRETFEPHVRYVNMHHRRCFTVVTALVGQMLSLEDELIRHMFEVKPSDRPDVSIGLCWAYERSRRNLRPSERFAPLYLPDQDREVMLRVYGNEEWGEFNE